MMRARVIAIVGAECTGKTALAALLGKRLADDGDTTCVVTEYLREFCDTCGRTPRQDEQAAIAAEQTRRIDAAAATQAVVIADTTALLTAVYSEFVFGDRSLYPQALADHRRADLTLVTALDLPWQPDGLQRDGPQVREPVDALLRAALRRGGIGFSVVSGSGDARLAAALRAARCLTTAAGETPTAPRWQWHCERCGDADCDRHWLPTTLS